MNCHSGTNISKNLEYFDFVFNKQTDPEYLTHILLEVCAMGKCYPACKPFLVSAEVWVPALHDKLHE